MQEANSKLQASLEKVTAQNAESLKELNQAKERSRDLERMLSEAKSKSNGSAWMWIAILAIVIIIILLAI